MTRNLIPGLQKVDWSDTQRQNEYVNSVVSALNALGEKLDYDYVCAVSGSAFRTSFAMEGWNEGSYQVCKTPIIIAHTFKMLGCEILYRLRRKDFDFAANSRLIMESIDKGVPVITVGGIINCCDACVISGYDNNGAVLLGYNPFMDIEDDHNEAPDDTGYFRKSDWHNGYFESEYDSGIIIIKEKCEKPSEKAIFDETAKLIARLIQEKSLVPNQHNGLAAHKAFANALLTYEWDDNFTPYLNVMCNYKQYLDRQYAVKFFERYGRNDLAGIYKEIAGLCAELAQIIPQDFSAGDMFGDKTKLKPYCDLLTKIHDKEQKVLALL
jgi:hypothetical protein